MGSYSEIWAKVVEFEKVKKERRRKARAEKEAQREVAKLEETVDIPVVEDEDLIDEAVEGEEVTLTAVGETADYRVIKKYKAPPFTPDAPNLEKNGALYKYKKRY